MRFWFSMAFRIVFLLGAMFCWYSAFRNPTLAMAWIGASYGFYSAGKLERLEQVARGEVPAVADWRWKGQK